MNPISDFFDLNVRNEHATGDIWVGLSCLGLLGHAPIRGVVISPACDLSNRKVETITYLPIIPIKQYFRSPAFLSQLIPRLNEVLSRANLETLDVSQLRDNGIKLAVEAIDHRLTEVSDSIIRVQIESGIKLLRRLDCTDDEAVDYVEKLFATKFDRLRKELIRNSLRTDIHFVPSDRNPVELSAVAQHSVVLFRYPITIPISVLDAAQDFSCDWGATCAELSVYYPIVTGFSKSRPQKRARINQRFMADMITRYLALYLRLGSPDFPKQWIESFSAEIR